MKTIRTINGSLEQCVRDFARNTGLGRFQSDYGINRREAFRRRTALANLFGLKHDTLKNWLSGGALPTGDKLIRLIVLLEAVGYEVTHHEGDQHLDAHRKNLMAAIVLLGVSADELAQKADFMSYQGLYDYIFARNGISASKQSLIDEAIDGEMVAGIKTMLSKRGEEISGAIQASFQKHTGPAPASSSRQSASNAPGGQAILAQQPDSALPLLTPTAAGHHVAYLASLIMGALPLAAALIQDRSPNGEKARNRLRELTRTAGGSNGVFDLSNLLNALCSEKARTTTQQQH